MKPNRVIIAGGRDFGDYNRLCWFMDQWVLDNDMGPDNTDFISGEAKGADILGKKWALSRGYKVVLFPAQWDKVPAYKLYERIVAMRGKNINGQVFGNLVVDGKSGQTSHGSPLWSLTCSICGGQNFRTVTDLQRGRVSCLARCRNVVASESPVRSIYGNYSRNAAKLGRVFELPFEWFADAITQDCYYCYSSPVTTFKKKGSRSGVIYNGLDRIDSSRGYTIDNVVPCCKFCNFAKGRWGVEDFNDWLLRVRAGHGKAAGYIRNKAMADEATHLVAWWNENSPGTGNMIWVATKAGLKVHIEGY